MKFSLTFNQDQIKPSRQQALEKLASQLTLKGFRQGKAPLDMVEQSVGQEKIVEETVNQLIPTAYLEYVKKHNLKPITQPKITLKKLVADGDWEFEVEIAEKPEVKLNNYQDAIRGELAKETIWTPDKDIKEEDKEKAETKKLTKVFDTLLATAEVEIPDLLVDEEVNRALARLLEQVEKLGLTIDQYLASIGKKAEDLRVEYQKTAKDNLKLEFILDAIARDQKVEATDSDLEAVLSQVTDPQALEAIKKNPVEVASIKYSVIKHKVVDYLMSLA